MKKRIAISVDDDVYEGLKSVPRGISISEFVSFMLRGMLKEVVGGFAGKGTMTQEEFNKWVESDPELKKVREGIRESLGPSVYPVVNGVKKMMGVKKKEGGSGKK